MIRANKREIFTDYRESYFYRQQRRKRRSFRIKLLALFLLVAVFSAVLAKANEQAGENSLVFGPQLLFEHPDANMRAALPVDMAATVDINGLIAYTEVRQTFFNPFDIVMEGHYQFPLPDDGAVHYLKVVIDDRTIIGNIMEKKAAKKAYIKAKQQGKKASLVEQQRPNIFTNKIANIPPKTKVEVVIRFY